MSNNIIVSFIKEFIYESCIEAKDFCKNNKIFSGAFLLFLAYIITIHVFPNVLIYSVKGFVYVCMALLLLCIVFVVSACIFYIATFLTLLISSLDKNNKYEHLIMILGMLMFIISIIIDFYVCKSLLYMWASFY